MAFSPSSPVTGAAETGLTSPTYTISSDTVGPNAHSKQYVVTALGGTQTGVAVHSVSNPFTLTMERPASFRYLGVPNPVTGVISNVPFNVYKYRTRKGVDVASGQSKKVAYVETKVYVPAGADTEDPLSIEAMMSLHGGALWGNSAAIGNILKDGVL